MMGLRYPSPVGGRRPNPGKSWPAGRGEREIVAFVGLEGSHITSGFCNPAVDEQAGKCCKGMLACCNNRLQASKSVTHPRQKSMVKRNMRESDWRSSSLFALRALLFGEVVAKLHQLGTAEHGHLPFWPQRPWQSCPRTGTKDCRACPSMEPLLPSCCSGQSAGFGIRSSHSQALKASCCCETVRQ